MNAINNRKHEQASAFVKYADIIDLPHFHDPARPFMSMHDRAAQFAPYKALGEDLTGEEMVDDSYKVELFEDEL